MRSPDKVADADASVIGYSLQGGRLRYCSIAIVIVSLERSMGRRGGGGECEDDSDVESEEDSVGDDATSGGDIEISDDDDGGCSAGGCWWSSPSDASSSQSEANHPLSPWSKMTDDGGAANDASESGSPAAAVPLAVAALSNSCAAATSPVDKQLSPCPF